MYRQKQMRRSDGHHGIRRVCLLQKRRSVDYLQYVLALPLYLKMIQRCVIRAGIPRMDMLKIVLLQRLGETHASSRVGVLFSCTSLLKDIITGQILLPSAYLPPLVDVGLLVGLVFIQTFFCLLFQRWSTTTKRFVAYKRANQPCDADAVLVIPFSHAGAREICPLRFESGSADVNTMTDHRAQYDDKESDEWCHRRYGKIKLSPPLPKRIIIKAHTKNQREQQQQIATSDKWGEVMEDNSQSGSEWEMEKSLGKVKMEKEEDSSPNVVIGMDNVVDSDFVESQEGRRSIYSDDVACRNGVMDCKEEEVSSSNCYSIQQQQQQHRERLGDDDNCVENEEAAEAAAASDADVVENKEEDGGVAANGSTLQQYFEYQNRRFVLSEPFHAFIIGNPQFRMIELPTQMKISHYLERAAEGLRSESDIERAGIKFGPNQLSLLQLTYRKVLLEVLFTPFKFFELFTYGLQLLDVGAQQTVQSVVFMLFTTAFEANELHSARLRGSNTDVNFTHRRVRVLRKGAWEDVHAEDLVPGDVVSLVSGERLAKYHHHHGWKIPADMLLLCGHALCDESSLTGESIPVPKVGISDTVVEIGMEKAGNTHLDMKGAHRSNMLLSSTTLLYCRASSSTTTTTTAGGLKSSSTVLGATATVAPASSESLLPEDEIKAYVVRTGFYSTEGKLMRMAKRSQEPVRADYVEMGKVMLLLLIFAISAMVYTLQRGRRVLVDGPIHSSSSTITTTTRFSTFRLVLQCIRILSVTVPPHMPYTISRRCTQALLRISAHGLACSEPWRIPWASCVSQVLLDKTGTLTSADLAPCETWTWSGGSSRLNETNMTTLPCNDKPVSGAPHLAPFEMCAIISSCHSLVECRSSSHERQPIDRCGGGADTGGHPLRMIGDPIELSGLGAVNWTFNSTTNTARGQAVVMEDRRNESSSDGGGVVVGEVEVLKHFAFSSTLQRMSVLGTVKRSRTLKYGAEKMDNDYHLEDSGVWCLTKGSPESILPLLDPSSIPSWYEDKYTELGREGKRTIALAYNPNIVEKLAMPPALKEEEDDTRTSTTLARKYLVATLAREDCEMRGSMQFIGFASFDSPLRTDSTSVVSELKTKGGCTVTMVTGDGPYTAVTVATASGIIPRDHRYPTLLLTVENDNNTCTGVDEEIGGGFLGHKNKYRNVQPRLVWKPLQESPRGPKHREGLTAAATSSSSKKSDPDECTTTRAFIPSRMAELSLKHSLCVTGHSLRVALSSPQRKCFCKNLHCIRVFSRVSPELKEEVTTLIAATGRIVLFCGDGGNDVGALKSAHLGVALLSGFGMTNTRSSSGNVSGSSSSSSHEINPSMEDSGPATSSRQLPQNIRPMWCTYGKVNRREQENRCDDGKTPTRFLRSLWFSILRRRNTAVKATTQHKNEKSKSLKKAHSEEAVYGGLDNVTGNNRASLAAPFTSTKPSISACVDLIKHGKHTAALILTIYQVVILESLLSGYALSHLYLEGVWMSFNQKLLMMLSSMMSIYFIEEAPKDVNNYLSDHHIPGSVFHPSILSSTLAQAVCHIGSCAFAIHSAKCATPLDVLEEAQRIKRRKFMPSLVSNVMLIMSLCQRASLTICCYKGWPFTRPLAKMPGMISYAFMMTMTSLMLIFNVSPRLNTFLDIYPWGSWSLQVYYNPLILIRSPHVQILIHRLQSWALVQYKNMQLAFPSPRI